MEEASLHALAHKLKESRKYRGICEDTLYRVSAWALERHPNPKQATKAAKRKLHQIYGAFCGQIKTETIERLLSDLPSWRDGALLRDACKRILQCHASTQERLPVMEALFSELFRRTGRPKRIMDLACGLNPFAWPWMGLGLDTVYHAVDIDCRLISHINGFFAHMGITGSAVCEDILTSIPSVESDVVLLLKALPGLEQQDKGSSIKLLEGLQTRHIAVSFPVKSLGSREKGMQQHYGHFMEQLVDGLDASVEMTRFSNEALYIIDRRR